MTLAKRGEGGRKEGQSRQKAIFTTNDHYNPCSTHFGTLSRSISPRFQASKLSFHRLAHRHHLHPPFKRPRRSLPRDALKLSHWSLTTAATVCEP